MDIVTSDRLSVVVPVLDEEGSLEALQGELRAALDGRFDYEVLYVDDGSSDRSFEVLERLHHEDSRVRVIRFRRNFGQTAALSAGFAAARGDVVVALDADRQNDPSDIPNLVTTLDEGHDVVSGWRRRRHDRAITRRLPSWLANRVISAITGLRLHDYGCTLKAYRRQILQELRLYGEMHRYIPALASWIGARVTEREVRHRARTSGSTKYGLGRTAKVILDLVTVRFLGTYSTRPLHVFGGLGLLLVALAVLSGSVLVYQKLSTGADMTGSPLLLLTAVLAITSVQFVLMGLLAELLTRTYHESQERPTYAIRETLGTSPFEG
jgi:glycosyltransferase involved in cell wall biosynthesis